MKPLQNTLKVIFGSISEWYEFVIFNSFALKIGETFFPKTGNYKVILLQGTMIFALGYIARPIGALFFSRIADQKGRSFCLKLTPITIALSSLTIALLPGYEKISVLAPCIVVLLRFIQGMTIGGEYSNAIVYLFENAGRYKGFAVSLAGIAAAIGISLASGIASLVAGISAQFSTWRICFFIASFLGMLTFIYRINMSETNEFKKIQNMSLKIKLSFLSSLKKYWKIYLFIIGIHCFYCISFYFQISYLPNYLERNFGLSKSLSLNLVSKSLLINAFALPLAGLIIDKFKATKILLIICFLSLFIYQFLFQNINHTMAYYSFSIISMFNAVALPIISIDIIPANLRSTIYSFCYNLSMGIIGGTTAIVCTSLELNANTLISPISYVYFSAVITILFLFIITKKTKRSCNINELLVTKK